MTHIWKVVHDGIVIVRYTPLIEILRGIQVKLIRPGRGHVRQNHSHPGISVHTFLAVTQAQSVADLMSDTAGLKTMNTFSTSLIEAWATAYQVST